MEILPSAPIPVVLVPIGTGAVEGRETNSRQSQSQRQVQPTDSSFILILVHAKFYEDNTETKETVAERQFHPLRRKEVRWWHAEGRLRLVG